MDDLFLLVDFGSTYTKVLLVDMDKEEILSRAQSPTTVQNNILIGLQNALKKLKIKRHRITYDTLAKTRKLACSSAAGGLRLIAVGLVPELTLEAAKRAALGAGAKLVGSFSYELDEETLSLIEQTECDIILLCGGTDGGNKQVILHNAKMLSKSRLNVPFVTAGNRVVGAQVKRILESNGKFVEKTENVLPDLDQLNVEPARSCIREIFMKRIVHAKGMDQAQGFIGDILMPTPMATLKAAQLMADGYGKEAGLGELMVVEVGGATTNIHSISTGVNADRPIAVKGIPEPYAKRTVEGDLGIRYNAATIIDILGVHKVIDNIPQKPFEDLDLIDHTKMLSKNVSYIPKNEHDVFIDLALARSAIHVAVERHAGLYKESWTPFGVIKEQFGKDLTGIKTIIGTGGIFAFNPYSKSILDAALFDKNNPLSLKPISSDFYIDKNYMLYGIGLLSEIEPEKALRLGKKYLLSLKPDSDCGTNH